MPTYEYACRGCGQHLEVVQSFKDDALTQCPSCDGELRKVFSAAGLIFKGSGWHVKDYASSGSKGGSGSSGSGEGGSSDSSSSSKDGSSKTTESSSSSPKTESSSSGGSDAKSA